jgi:hypothetical protein
MQIFRQAALTVAFAVASQAATITNPYGGTVEINNAVYQLGVVTSRFTETIAEVGTNGPRPIEASSPGTYSTGFGTASLTLSPVPILEVSASSGENLQTTSLITVWSSFIVVGGTAGAAVPLKIDYSLSVNGIGDPSTRPYPSGTGFARLTAEAPLGSAQATVVCSNSGSACVNNESHGTLDLLSAQGYNNNMRLEIWATSTQGGYGYAFLDPRIYVDPAFADANLYSILVSPFIGNESVPVQGAVPEPGTLAILGSGLGVLGIAFRRRRLQ